MRMCVCKSSVVRCVPRHLRLRVWAGSRGRRGGREARAAGPRHLAKAARSRRSGFRSDADCTHILWEALRCLIIGPEGRRGRRKGGGGVGRGNLKAKKLTQTVAKPQCVYGRPSASPRLPSRPLRSNVWRVRRVWRAGRRRWGVFF